MDSDFVHAIIDRFDSVGLENFRTWIGVCGQAYIIIGHLGPCRLLNQAINTAIDDTKSVEMYVFCSLLRNCSITDLFILFLEESSKSRSIAASIAFCPQADSAIMWFIVWKLEEPSLSKVPNGMCRMDGRICSGVVCLPRKGADSKCIILLRD